MAHTISGLRNIRRNDKRRLRNKAVKSEVRTGLKKVAEAVAKKDKTASAEALKAAYRLLDRAAAAKVLHKNAAARHKSALASKVATLK